MSDKVPSDTLECSHEQSRVWPVNIMKHIWIIIEININLDDYY